MESAVSDPLVGAVAEETPAENGGEFLRNFNAKLYDNSLTDNRCRNQNQEWQKIEKEEICNLEDRSQESKKTQIGYRSN